MDHKALMEREAAYEPAVRNLIRSVNTRLSQQPAAGQTWVRLRPPTEEELVDEKLNPRFVRFHRIGSAAKVTTALPDFVEIHSGGATTMIGVREFLESWVRLVSESEWGRQAG